MLPLTRSRNRARFFGIPFSPSSLFAAGEQGAWYDPSDYSTLFTDSAGTTPVTGVEQFVGLMLDKSKGLVLGPELVTNGGPGFTATTGWGVSNATVTASGGKLVCEKTGASSAVYWTLATAIGTWYQVNISWENVNATNPSILVNSTGGLSITTSNTTATVYFLAVATSTFVQMQLGSGAVGTQTRIISLSTKTIPGNHAFQTSSAKRPKLAARYNLLTYSEEFDVGGAGAWSSVGLTRTANTDVAPDGTTSADTVTGTSTTNAVLYNTTPISVIASSVTLSIYVKAGTAAFVVLSLWAGSGGNGANQWFDLQAGTLGSTTATAGYSITSSASTSLPNGWYRISITGNVPTASLYMSFRIVDADGTFVYTNTVGDTAIIWGADLRPADQATGLIGPTYQRVAAATVYDTAGFLPYLAFDGLTWSMSTNSINPGAVDKAQVFAGVRKLSDGVQVFAEHSADYNANNGTWLMWSNTGANNSWYFDSKGTTIASGKDPALSAAPITSVLTGIGDISAPLVELRKNGVSVVTNTNTQGTGNYLTYPLFIGMRNNASFQFNGWMSSLIVRFGPNLSTSQIEATEAWVNSRTGAF